MRGAVPSSEDATHGADSELVGFQHRPGCLLKSGVRHTIPRQAQPADENAIPKTGKSVWMCLKIEFGVRKGWFAFGFLENKGTLRQPKQEEPNEPFPPDKLTHGQ